MVRQAFAIGGVLTLASFALLAFEDGPTSHGSSPSSQASKDRTVVALYGKLCLSCHGADGKGTEMRKVMPDIPDLANPEWQKGMSDSQITVSILEGKGTLMPPFRDHLND